MLIAAVTNPSFGGQTMAEKFEQMLSVLAKTRNTQKNMSNCIGGRGFGTATTTNYGLKPHLVRSTFDRMPMASCPTISPFLYFLFPHLFNHASR
jgi:hypothetical protein